MVCRKENWEKEMHQGDLGGWWCEGRKPELERNLNGRWHAGRKPGLGGNLDGRWFAMGKHSDRGHAVVGSTIVDGKQRGNPGSERNLDGRQCTRGKHGGPWCAGGGKHDNWQHAKRKPRLRGWISIVNGAQEWGKHSGQEGKLGGIRGAEGWGGWRLLAMANYHR